MIVSGILHTSLGGLYRESVVSRPWDNWRGISEFNPKYQRNLIEAHRTEIERFLEDGEDLFFPEVVPFCRP